MVYNIKIFVLNNLKRGVIVYMRNVLKRLLHFKIFLIIYIISKNIYSFFHKAFTAIKALLFFVMWNIKEKNSFYKKIGKDYGVYNIKPYDFLHWKHGCKYFIGLINQERVFIKSGGLINTTSREIYSLMYAKNNSYILDKHTPNLITKNPNSDYVLIERMMNGISADDSFKFNEVEIDSIVNQIYEIYLELKNNNIIHMDIKPSNFIIENVENNLTVYIFDFGFSIVNSKNIYENIIVNSKSKNIIKNLGSQYSQNNDRWDDAYSFLMTLKKINPSLMHTHYEIWKSLNEDIGLNEVGE